MTSREMQMDFRLKFNKIDSQKNRNILVPEVDWHLNEAMEIFINLVANPKANTHLGFETSQATIDDLYPLITKSSPIVPVAGVIPLPVDYHTFLKAYANITKDSCTARARMFLVQHDDRAEDSSNYNSSFEWREIIFRFLSGGLEPILEGTDIEVNSAEVTYLKQAPYIHAASLFPGGTYTIPGGATLTGNQDCILPKRVHGTIVDIAVMVASNNIQASDYQLKQNKVSVNQIL
jgi:hypothetical protein